MFTGLESPWHLLVLGLIAVIVFGPKRLPDLGRSLGSGIRGFKDSLEGRDDVRQAEVPAPPVAAMGSEPEKEAKPDTPG